MMRAYLDRMLRPWRRPSAPAKDRRTPPLTEGYVVKGGRNQGPSQIVDRPAAPGAIKPGQPPRQD